MEGLAIIVIAYNNSDLTIPQINAMAEFSKDPYYLIIVDNSTDEEQAKAIEWKASQHSNIKYVRVRAASVNGSDSHAFAANLAFNMFKDKYEYMFFADHDLFPVEPFSVKEIIGNQTMAFLPQVRNGIVYPWPGCLMFKVNDLTKNGIDMTPNVELGLDTGGNIYPIVSPDDIRFNEVYEQNPLFNKGLYNFYSIIGGTFMHFINSSNWNKSESNQERMNTLFEILRQKIMVKKASCPPDFTGNN